MIVKTQTSDLICFGCKLTHTNIQNHLVECGLLYYGRGLSKKVTLLDINGVRLGRYELPRDIVGKLLHGYAKGATFTKVAE